MVGSARTAGEAAPSVAAAAAETGARRPPAADPAATVKPAERLPSARGGCAHVRPVWTLRARRVIHEPTLRANPSHLLAGRARRRGLVGVEAGAPGVPERRRLVPVAGRGAAALRGRDPAARRALATHPRPHRRSRLAHRHLRAHGRRLHGEQRASRSRRRGAQGRAALAALRREQAHSARVGGGRAHPRPARAGRDLRGRRLWRAQLERAPDRPAADHGRSRRGAAGGRGHRALVHAQPPHLRSRTRLAEAARRRSARPARARRGAAAGRHLRAVGVRGGRVPGRRSLGRSRFQRHGCALPRRADQLRRGASRRPGVDRHLRRRRRLRRPAGSGPAARWR